MTTSEAPPATTCAECGCSVDPAAAIPALDGQGLRCADFDGCHDRKEDRSSFGSAA